MKQSERSAFRGIHVGIYILLMGLCALIFRLSGQASFRDAASGNSFEDSRAFASQFTQDICDAISYTNLADRFETDGRLDVDKVVLRGKDEEGETVAYTLKNAIDYGQTIGIYFDAQNHLSVKNAAGGAGTDSGSTAGEGASGTTSHLPGTSASVSTGGADRSEAENGDFPLIFSSDLNAANAAIDKETSLLSLLRQLEEYYDLQKYLGILSNERGAFHFRIILSGSSGAVLSANDSALTRTSVSNYGRYAIISSDQKTAVGNLPSGRRRSLMETLRGNNLLAEGSYEILAAVDTTYAGGGRYNRLQDEYQRYTRTLRGLGMLAILTILGLILSLARIAWIDRQTIYEEDTAAVPEGIDRWYAESLIFIAILSAIVIYWSQVEFRYGMKAHSAPDAAAGCVLFSLGFFPAEIAVLSTLRRHWSGRLLSSFFLYQGAQSVRDGYQTRNDRWTTGRSVLRALLRILGVTGLAACGGALAERGNVAAGAAMFLVLALAAAAILLHTSHEAEQKRKIYERVRSLTEGEVGTKLDSEKMSGRNRRLAETVNALDDSLENAVRERTSEERARTELIANVSHDLRTPLTSIISYVDLIRRENIQNPRVQEYLRILDEKAMRLKTMAEELMDASRAASGDLNIQWQRIDMVQMVYQVQGEFQDRLTEKKLTPVLRMTDHPAYIIADGKLVWRVLDNLYTNVCKYAQEETPVLVELQETAKNYVFTMKNVSAQPLKLSAERLEERFVRGDSSRSTEGSGLGLAIAKSMTEQLGGKFELFPDEDMFRIRLIFPAAGMTEKVPQDK